MDSGVNEVPGLDSEDKVNHGPDLSIEGNGGMVFKDTFGHGTYMAGIIAGRGTTGASGSLATAGPDVQLGVAPDATVESLKLANTDGSTDVSAVIAALDFMIQDGWTGTGDHVRVINLSYGTDSAQASMSDPLSAAVEKRLEQGVCRRHVGGQWWVRGHPDDRPRDQSVRDLGRCHPRFQGACCGNQRSNHGGSVLAGGFG